MAQLLTESSWLTEQGARLIFMDTVQYHPTGVAYPEQILGQLVTEKVRGLGANLVNVDGERFIYELETRDVVSAAIIRECTDRGKGVVTPTGMVGVWLDTPMIDILRGQRDDSKGAASHGQAIRSVRY
jgi:aspartate oxidase